MNHQGQFPSVTISFNLPVGTALSDAVPVIEQAERDIGMPSSDPRKFSRVRRRPIRNRSRMSRS